jgi:hypothetical protein
VFVFSFQSFHFTVVIFLAAVFKYFYWKILILLANSSFLILSSAVPHSFRTIRKYIGKFKSRDNPRILFISLLRSQSATF